MHWSQAAIAVPLAPALPAAGEGLAALFPLLAWVTCLGLLWVWRRTVGALIEHLANLLDSVSVPVFGRRIHVFGPVSAGLRGVDWAIQLSLDKAAKATERATVYLFHKSVATFELVGRELYHIAEDAGRALDTMIVHTIPHLVKIGVHGLEHRVEQQFRFYRSLVARTDNRVSRLRDDVHAIGHSTTVALPRDIGRVRTREGRLEHDVEALKARVGRLAAFATLAGFTAFMWRWMGRFGLRWLRCPSLARIGSRLGCIGFKFLEDLLFGVIDVLVIADLCRITRKMIDLAESKVVRDALHEFIDGMDKLLLCRNVKRPDPFVVTEVDLPPAQEWADLPKAA